MIPFLDQYLKGGPPANIAKVTAFEAGTNQWQRLADWPPACARGCPANLTPLYLAPGERLGFDAPAARGVRLLRLRPGQAGHLPRPPQPLALGAGLDLAQLAGRRPALRRRPPRRPHLHRPTPLTQPLRLAGTPLVHLVASTSGTDSDWVVKLIDVYPDQYPQKPELGGYQLAIAMDVMRGRYRDRPGARRSRVPANQPRHLRIRAADRRLHRPARPPADGPGPVELVPALRPQPADLRPQHLLRQAAATIAPRPRRVFTGPEGTWIGLPVVK